jgi:two-component system CheB/CheR fusion protein
VRTANGGFRAIEVAESFHPDIVLLDIELPKLNGYEIARQIRRHAWSRATLLIAMTGWADDEQVRLIRECGFEGHLVKPSIMASLPPFSMALFRAARLQVYVRVHCLV